MYDTSNTCTPKNVGGAVWDLERCITHVDTTSGTGGAASTAATVCRSIGPDACSGTIVGEQMFGLLWDPKVTSRSS